MLLEYPRHKSEFEYHSAVYGKLISFLGPRGYIIRGRVESSRYKCQGVKKGSRQAVFDIVVFTDQKIPVLIIEVKRYTPETDKPIPAKYKEIVEALGIPFLFIGGSDDVIRKVSDILKIAAGG